jgi:hypothetical protein
MGRRRRTTVAPRPQIVGLLVLLVAGTTVAAVAGCGPDGSAGRPYEPTLPAVDFRPRLVLVVPDDGPVRAEPGERTDQPVGTDPPRVPSGSVVTVRNGGSRDQRLRGGDAFDTGIVRPGEETVVVLTNPGGDPLDLELVEVEGHRPEGRLTVEPATGGAAGT